MGRHRAKHVGTRLLLAGGLTLGAAVTALAEDPPKDDPEQKAQQQEQTESRQGSAPKGSLAAAASKIKLQKPADSESGGMVITDHNVKSAGSGAVVSQGSGSVSSGAAGSPAASAGTTASSATRADKLASELLAQKAKVDNMEAQLASYDKQLEAPPVDPHYPQWSKAPQFRGPGVQAPATSERDEYAKRLEEERAKLEQLLKEAEGAGVRVSKTEAKAPAGGQD